MTVARSGMVFLFSVRGRMLRVAKNSADPLKSAGGIRAQRRTIPMSHTNSSTGSRMAGLQPFDNVAKTGSSNDRCESLVLLRRGFAVCRTLGRLLLIVLLAAISSDRAFASCGDYLHTRTSSPAVSVAHHDVEATPGDEHQRKAPCSGPECRSVPRSPAIPPVVPSGVVRNSELAMVDLEILIESSGHQNAFVRISSARVARGFPAQIDVPPECV